jgi:hypothetical protein
MSQLNKVHIRLSKPNATHPFPGSILAPSAHMQSPKGLGQVQWLFISGGEDFLLELKRKIRTRTTKILQENPQTFLLWNLDCNGRKCNFTKFIFCNKKMSPSYPTPWSFYLDFACPLFFCIIKKLFLQICLVFSMRPFTNFLFFLSWLVDIRFICMSSSIKN